MKRPVLLVSALLAVAACDTDLTVPNLNNPSAGQAATRSSVLANAQGLLASARTLATQGVRFHGIWGRESYDLRPQEPRPHTDNLIGPRDPLSSNAATYFTNNYTAIVNVRNVLKAVDAVDGMTDAEREAIRGWAKTVEAFAYFQLAVTHPEFGAPLDPPESPTGELGPIGTPEQLYDRAITLFDEAAAHLRNGGTKFPFVFTDGYAPFDTPAEFLKVNRALKARTLKYMGRWSDVLTALDESFVDPSAPMDLGVWHSYSLADGTNPFYNVATDYIHPRIRAEAQLKPDATLDNRALRKTTVIAPVTEYGVTVTERPAMYASADAPFPWIKNEELLLIRAEAKLATGDAPGALADVNVVRQASGGLAPLASVANDEALLDEILYNKRYSLLWEGGFTYLDAFQYNKLDELPRLTKAELGGDFEDHVIFTRLGWPQNECLARGMTSGPCGTIVGDRKSVV